MNVVRIESRNLTPGDIILDYDKIANNNSKLLFVVSVRTESKPPAMVLTEVTTVGIDGMRTWFVNPQYLSNKI
jgi:hypothetical protein